MKQMFFWNSFAFSLIQWTMGIWFLAPLPFLNPACMSGTSQFTYCWSLAWRILSISLTSMQNEHGCTVVWTFFGIDLLWDWNKNWFFQSCGHCWVFQICWHFNVSLTPVSVQESPVEAWVGGGLLQGWGHWVQQCLHGTFWRRSPLSSLSPP